MTRRPVRPMQAATTDELIQGLTRELTPVRRLSSPWLRAFIWLMFAAIVITIITITYGPRHDLADRMAEAGFWTEWVGATLTGILATIATFHLSLPDRSQKWFLLPLPALAFWVSALGYGCYRDWVSYGPEGLTLGTSFGCFASILLTSIPLGLVLLYALRHAARIRPLETVTTAALAVAALAAAGLSFYHHLNAAIMVLVWHIGSVAVIVTISRLHAQRLMGVLG